MPGGARSGLTLLTGALVALLSGCAGPAFRFESDRYTVEGPFTHAAGLEFVREYERAWRDLGQLHAREPFGFADPGPVQVRVVVTDVPHSEFLRGGVDGVGAVYTPLPPTILHYTTGPYDARLGTWDKHHELAHHHLRHLLGTFDWSLTPALYDEGLAEVATTARKEGGRLWLLPSTRRLLALRLFEVERAGVTDVPFVTLAEIVARGPHQDGWPGYAAAWAVCFFLIHRQAEDVPYPDRVRAVLAIPLDELPALEAEWQAFRREYEPAPILAEALRHGPPELRDEVRELHAVLRSPTLDAALLDLLRPGADPFRAREAAFLACVRGFRDLPAIVPLLVARLEDPLTAVECAEALRHLVPGLGARVEPLPRAQPTGEVRTVLDAREQAVVDRALAALRAWWASPEADACRPASPEEAAAAERPR